MARVILEGYIQVTEHDLPSILEALPEHIAKTKQEPGCLVFEVTQRPHLPCYFDVYEIFEDEHAFEQHQARVTASSWGKISQNATRHYQIIKEPQ